ncbi:MULTISPECIES: hypothetical protein [Rhodococcus]|uniref:Lipoprotein n=1 Tax=Rhodococcus oxybenzonivorans TaxID=1990687 RepID=A0AAE4V2X5_9NOCA|nr:MULTISPECIES: hypothetical protein [Rhodococcus]MDV7243710.1 hypothetical protein [Rhodococcus oxybenzonivorans]MDV7267184.1 hypothetical protein [Rhodococcus oxybenzonivorans]MDV7275048.1 hypothetical protein [Rhodococcus oxybenzonivorans]MDV7335286.1 hypothetical protein [Rhodococcus oxybenzonivorans]MDV7345997.1 hypothetical protein [Rhodococcus oxybenzonivorans]
MSPIRALVTVLLLGIFAVSGCAGRGTSVPNVTSTGTPPTTTALPTTTSAPPPPVVEEPAPALAPEPEVTSEPITFECGDPTLYQYGTALYSDGTTGYEPSCDTSPPGRELRYCDYGGTAVYTDGSYSTTDPACHQPVPAPSGGESGYPYDPSQDRNGDGVVSGYERCGTACGEAPTSGEIQMQYGCEEGWIDPETCALAGY